jgi:hypothetical protein
MPGFFALSYKKGVQQRQFGPVSCSEAIPGIPGILLESLVVLLPKGEVSIITFVYGLLLSLILRTSISTKNSFLYCTHNIEPCLIRYI